MLRYETPSSVEAGKGYWVKVDTDTKVIVSGSLATDSYSIQLYPSWNQIGCPFNFEVDWSKVKFIHNGAEKSPFEAGEEGWISNAIYWCEYIPEMNSYSYLYGPGDICPNPRFSPWKGYWINVNVDNVALRIPNIPAAGSGTSSSGSPYLSSKKATCLNDGSWALQIVVRTKGAVDLSNFIGTRADLLREYDHLDAKEPPPSLGSYISLGFPHYDWGKSPGLYTSDYRPPIQDQEIWDLVVSSNLADEEVTLSWDNVREVPKKYDLTLLNKESGQRIDMRKSSSYTYNSDSNLSSRSFSVIVKRGSAILDSNTPPFNYPNPAKDETTIRVTISSGGAAMTARIYDIAGELVVEKLPLEKKNDYYEGTWYLKNDRDKKVASGVYLFIIEADGKAIGKPGKMAVVR